MQFLGRTSYHDYEGIALNLDERECLVRDLGNNNAMILRHHGLLTTGRTVGDAFYEMYYLEQASRLQLAATQGGQTVVVPPDSVAEHTARQFESFQTRASARGRRSSAGLTAKAPITRLDAGAPDYKSARRLGAARPRCNSHISIRRRFQRFLLPGGA